MRKQERSAYDSSKFRGYTDWPISIHDAAAWDALWSEVVDSNNRNYAILAPHITIDGNGYPAIRQFEGRDVLFIDNALLAIPYFFAHMGYNVIASDISPFAVEYCRNNEPSRPFWYQFFSTAPPVMRQEYQHLKRLYHIKGDVFENDVASYYAPGGSLTFECRDAFNRSEEQNIADIVVAHILPDRCDGEMLDELVSMIFRWVRPGGAAHIWSHRLGLVQGGIKGKPILTEAFQRAGFMIYGEDACYWYRQRDGFARRTARYWSRRFKDREDAEFADKLVKCQKNDIEVTKRDGRKLVIFGIP